MERKRYVYVEDSDSVIEIAVKEPTQAEIWARFFEKWRLDEEKDARDGHPGQRL